MTTKRILINKGVDLRVARVEGQKLYDIEIEQADDGHKSYSTGTICNGRIVKIQSSLNAVFIDFGADKNGFLPLREVVSEHGGENEAEIARNLREGQKVLVQITKEERGSKGAALSMFIALAGSYVVLMPCNTKAGGISRQISGEDRDAMKTMINTLKLPEGFRGSFILRTAALGRAIEEVQWDLDALIRLWNLIQQASQTYPAPYLIHEESDIVIRAARDHLKPDIGEILVDDADTFSRLKAYVEKVRPDFVDRLKWYNDPIPLFSRFQVESQIEMAFQRNVRLPSGGEIVIDVTEALIVIDVNSARATKGRHIEETALNTNLEAAQEIARQLRIRDLGGLFVIDFIDMEEEENRRKVEQCLHDALKLDRARTQMGHISRFGLLEMSRQRERSALSSAQQVICPRCHGQGSIRNIKAQAASILRLVEETALKSPTEVMHIQAPVPIATYLLNELQESIHRIEHTHHLLLRVIPNPYMESPQYQIQPIHREALAKLSGLSYELIDVPRILYPQDFLKAAGETFPPVPSESAPAVQNVLPKNAAPSHSSSVVVNLLHGWKKIGSLLSVCAQRFTIKKVPSTEMKAKEETKASSEKPTDAFLSKRPSRPPYRSRRSGSPKDRQEGREYGRGRPRMGRARGNNRRIPTDRFPGRSKERSILSTLGVDEHHALIPKPDLAPIIPEHKEMIVSEHSSSSVGASVKSSSFLSSKPKTPISSEGLVMVETKRDSE